MRLLVIVPDYASHYARLGAVGAAARDAGHGVTFATGGGLLPRIRADGHRWVELVMSAGSNTGRRPVRVPGDDLTAFIEATRLGMVAVLRQQADRRADDLPWQPDRVARRTLEVVGAVDPDVVLADHLCVAARLALATGGVRTVTFVPGHPSQLPVGDEVYGVPVAWPTWAEPVTEDLDALRTTCLDIADSLASLGTDLARRIDPAAPPVDDVFGALGAGVLYNSFHALHDRRRHAQLPVPHAFLGAAVRRPEVLDAEAEAWVAQRRPFVYVSLGTFLSARVDLLAQLIAALRAGGWRAALATGSADVADLGPVLSDWLVRPFPPQVALVAEATGVVCHGGNNSVGEALAVGKPLLVLPLSTDQFTIAADVERSGVGRSADANRSSLGSLAEALHVLDDPAVRARAMEVCATAMAGADAAVRALQAMM